MQKETFSSTSKDRFNKKYILYITEKCWRNFTLSFNIRKFNIKIKMQASELQYSTSLNIRAGTCQSHLISINT